MRFAAYAASALFILAVLTGYASAPQRLETEAAPEEPPCLNAQDVHEFMRGAGAKPYAGGRTGNGPFVVWIDRQGRWAAIGYPRDWPGRACLLAQGVEWVGPFAQES